MLLLAMRMRSVKKVFIKGKPDGENPTRKMTEKRHWLREEISENNSWSKNFHKKNTWRQKFSQKNFRSGKSYQRKILEARQKAPAIKTFYRKIPAAKNSHQKFATAKNPAGKNSWRLGKQIPVAKKIHT